MIIYERGEPLLLKLHRQIVHAKREDVEQTAEQIDFGAAASATRAASGSRRLANEARLRPCKVAAPRSRATVSGVPIARPPRTASTPTRKRVALIIAPRRYPVA